MLSPKHIRLLKDVKELEDSIGVAKQHDLLEMKTYKWRRTVSEGLTRLEKFGLVKELPAPKNGRARKTYKTTETGRQILKNLEENTNVFKEDGRKA